MGVGGWEGVTSMCVGWRHTNNCTPGDSPVKQEEDAAREARGLEVQDAEELERRDKPVAARVGAVEHLVEDGDLREKEEKG